jgi:hypothetical protein
MWKCKKCGEEIDDSYDSCWRCAAEELPEEQKDLVKDPSEETQTDKNKRIKRRETLIGLILIIIFFFGLYKVGSLVLDKYIFRTETFDRTIDSIVKINNSLKSERQWRQEYEDYLTALRSFSALAGGNSKPMSFDEFKRARQNPVSDYDIIIKWKGIKNKKDFYDYCLRKGYINQSVYDKYLSWRGFDQKKYLSGELIAKEVLPYISEYYDQFEKDKK